MIRFVFPRTSVVRLTVTLVALTLACRTASAQRLPFKIIGGGPAPDGLSILGKDSPHSATGHATYLGRYCGNGIAKVLSFDQSSDSGTFEGTFTFVAENGDKLVCTYGDPSNGADEVGEFQVFPACGGLVYVKFIAEFNPIPSKCTGRFKNLIGGSFTMVATTEPFELELDAEGFTPPFDYTWEGEGYLEFGRR